jgi:hypothetical protein
MTNLKPNSLGAEMNLGSQIEKVQVKAGLGPDRENFLP